MSQQNQANNYDGKATPEQTIALMASATLEDGQGEKLLALAGQVSFYFNALTKEGNIEPYIALQLAQAFQTTLLRGG
jgi:hypothetical protein